MPGHRSPTWGWWQRSDRGDGRPFPIHREKREPGKEAFVSNCRKALFLPRPVNCFRASISLPAAIMSFAFMVTRSLVCNLSGSGGSGNQTSVLIPLCLCYLLTVFNCFFLRLFPVPSSGTVGLPLTYGGCLFVGKRPQPYEIRLGQRLPEHGKISMKDRASHEHRIRRLLRFRP